MQHNSLLYTPKFEGHIIYRHSKLVLPNYKNDGVMYPVATVTICCLLFYRQKIEQEELDYILEGCAMVNFTVRTLD